ncbi:hypothetical protein DPMN_194406 [Dreissena polymorpha]|uniref:Uncharacterized protein n=1 Tax=Dreissena polymorpha TaxID=45954 RepID=A0A9D3Y177_DREPO|nr:hypothetical protein DPMN_194406 [Dreissena polymorpha]
MYYQVCVASLNFDFKGQHITDISMEDSNLIFGMHVYLMKLHILSGGSSRSLDKCKYGTQHYTVISTCRVLSAMMEQYIRFPESRHELTIIAYGFHE